jgi:hypothetical protein
MLRSALTWMLTTNSLVSQQSGDWSEQARCRWNTNPLANAGGQTATHSASGSLPSVARFAAPFVGQHVLRYSQSLRC